MRERRAGRSRTAALVLTASNAALAWAGGIALATGGIRMGDGYEERLPFDSPVFGGIALLAVVAAPNTAAALALWRDDRRAALATLVAGLLLSGWIGVQMPILGEVNGYHAYYLPVGLTLVVLGRSAWPQLRELTRVASHRPVTSA